MFWIRIFKILLLFIFILIVKPYEKNEEETIIIVGNSEYNLVKKSLISQLNVPSVKEPSIYKLFSIFTKRQLIDEKSSENIFKSDNIEIIRYYPLNITIITSWKGIDEMSLDEIAFFCQLIYQINGGAGVIEIGHKTKQLSAILTHSAFCWGKGYIKSDITNRIFFCNNFEFKNFPLLDHSRPIHNNYLRYQQPSVENTRSWSFNILGATYAHEIDNDDKKHKTHRKDVIHADAEKLKQIRRHNFANKKKVRKHRHRKIVGNKVIIDMSKVRSDVKKYECKYRKSCYVTGQLNLEIFYKEPVQEENSEKVPLTVDQLKLLCKYRKSCYDSAGIPTEQKKLLEDDNDDKGLGLLTGGGKKVIKANKKNKKSLRNIAAKTLKNAQKKVAEAVERLEDNPNYAFEKYLDETEELQRKKQKCKFRKSCYETGVIPFESQPRETYEEMIQRYWELLEDKLNFDVDFNIVRKKVPFEDLNMEEKKVACHYRKSCYETGIIPNISDKIFKPPVNVEETIEPIFSHYEEDKKLACKYRKSCYETGILPQISIIVPEVKEQVIPLNEDDFKVYCKFRKSCYAKEAKLEKDEDIEVKEDEQKIGKEIEIKEVEEKTSKEKEAEVEEKTKKEEKIQVKEEIKKEIKKEEQTEVKEEVKKKEKKQKKQKKNSIKEEAPTEIVINEIKAPSKKKDLKKEEGVNENSSKVKKSKKNKKEQVSEEKSVNLEIPKSKEASKKSKKDKVKKETDSSDILEEPKISKIEEEKPNKENDEPIEPKKSKKVKQKKESKVSEEKKHPSENKNWYEDINLDKYINYVYDLAKNIQNTDYSSYFKTQETEPKKHHEHVFDLEEESKKLKCHYRKSCYKTGEIPVLTHHVLESPAVEIKDHNSLFNIESENKKLACKYRKSCYESGEIPIIVSHITTHQPKVELEIPKNEEEFKSFCKYRKSCYETKIPPNLSEEGEKTIYIPFSEYDMKMKCKYRKSCYQPSDDYESKNDEEKEVVEEKITKIEIKKNKMDVDDDKVKKPVEMPKKGIIIEMSNQTEPVYDGNLKIVDKRDDKIIKIIQSQEDIKSKTNKAINCNPFRISCKQLLGLPLSQKAPRAKNGKKLCRKKK